MKPCQPDERLCNLLGTKGKNSRFTNFNLNINKELLWWLQNRTMDNEQSGEGGGGGAAGDGEIPEIELIIRASTIDGRRKGACLFCQVVNKIYCITIQYQQLKFCRVKLKRKMIFLAFISEFCNFCSLWYNSWQLLHTISRIPSHISLPLQKLAHVNPYTKPNLGSRSMVLKIKSVQNIPTLRTTWIPDFFS